MTALREAAMLRERRGCRSDNVAGAPTLQEQPGRVALGVRWRGVRRANNSVLSLLSPWNLDAIVSVCSDLRDGHRKLFHY